VVVDTPPILSVADSAALGRHAGANLLVLRAGERLQTCVVVEPDDDQVA